MKLTKAQRLFVKAGIEMCEYAYYKWVDTCDNCDVSCDIVKHRKKYKQIIREALEAYETEKLVQQAWAYERGFCAGRRINNTTKTQHT